MITLQDVKGNDVPSEDKYGFVVSTTDQALDAVLRQTFDLPEGRLVRIAVDQERMIINFYYDSEQPKTYNGGKVKMPCAGKIAQGGEYPHRLELKKVD